MQGRAHPGAGVHGVDKGHEPGEDIVPGEGLGPQVLAVGQENVDGHGDGLGNDNVGLHTFEASHIIEQEVHHGHNNQHIPGHIEDQKELIERNEIVKPAVDGVAPLRRDKVFRQEVQQKIAYPPQEQQQMGVFRGADIAQPELPVINHRFFHDGDSPRRECFWDKDPWACFRRERRCAGEGSRQWR